MNSSRRTTKLSPKQIKKIVIIVLIVAVLLVGLILVLRNRVKQQFGSSDELEVLSAEVTTGSISTSVYGSGMLADEDVEQLDIPSGVDVEKLYVSRGEQVEEGQLLATVDMNTVVAAMADLNDQISTLDSSIASAKSETVSSTISSSVSGRVKKIFAQVGDDVASTVYDNGALMLVSLDGYMAVDIDSSALTEGDSVTVETEAGKSYTGTVESVLDGTATVIVTDNGTIYGDTVNVLDSDGNTIGSGQLYIHDELKIMGYAGTVSYVYVSENSSIYSGSSLFGLGDTEYSVNYDSLLKQRAELEDDLNDLLVIYVEGAVYAPVSGTVKTINVTEAENKSSDDTSDEYFTISPDKTMTMSVSVDESQILSLTVGQNAIVTVDSIDDETFMGTVTEIDKVGTSSSGVTTYTAEITIDKVDGMLSGMSASAIISIDSVQDALLIPVSALNKTSNGYYVYTTYDEANQSLGGMVEVTVGVTNSLYAEISSGLTEGETVYYLDTESSSMDFMPGGDFSMGGGDMPSGGGNMGGGEMPSGGGGNMGGGSMPSGGGGNMGGGGMPSGGRG
jgi:multidrug efflux pump subunit AcrA (membrane-fusion protein)